MKQRLLTAASDRLLDAALAYYESKEYIEPFSSKEIADCVIHHAAACGVSAMVVAAPSVGGIGSIIAAGVAAGAIWAMYIKICKLIGATFSKNKLKAIAAAVLTNVATQLAGVFAINFVSTLIPNAGIMINGIGNFAICYVAGLIFLYVLTELFKVKRLDAENMTIEEWKEHIKDAFTVLDKKAVIKEAKGIFNDMKKDGSLDEMGKDVNINPEEDD